MKTTKRAYVRAACASAIAVSALFTQTAQAVTPDPGVALSGFWSAANTFKEYFDWRSFAGWGTVGTTNVAITLATGQSDGQMTRAVITALCGSVAAGTLANWRPASGPTVASHAKAIVKAGAVVGVASSCSWISYFVFNKVDAEIPKAQRAINMASPPNFAEIKDDAARWNNELLAMERAYRQAARNLTLAAGFAKQSSDRGCRSPQQDSVCAELSSQIGQYRSRAAAAMASFNSHGAASSAAIKELAYDVKS